MYAGWSFIHDPFRRVYYYVDNDNRIATILRICIIRTLCASSAQMRSALSLGLNVGGASTRAKLNRQLKLETPLRNFPSNHNIFIREIR